VLSVAEVEQGVRRGEEERTRAFLRSLEAHPVDRGTAEIVRELRAQGFTVGLADALIAATCILRGPSLPRRVAGQSAQASPSLGRVPGARQRFDLRRHPGAQ
jgi:hypothetical protein